MTIPPRDRFVQLAKDVVVEMVDDPALHKTEQKSDIYVRYLAHALEKVDDEANKKYEAELCRIFDAGVAKAKAEGRREGLEEAADKAQDLQCPVHIELAIRALIDK